MTDAERLDTIAAQLFKAEDLIRAEMTKLTLYQEVARMSGNETAADMLDTSERKIYTE